jgi:hypothetical protein
MLANQYAGSVQLELQLPDPYVPPIPIEPDFRLYSGDMYDMRVWYPYPVLRQLIADNSFRLYEEPPPGNMFKITHEVVADETATFVTPDFGQVHTLLEARFFCGYGFWPHPNQIKRTCTVLNCLHHVWRKDIH